MAIINWLSSNKEWIFSGIGVAVISTIVALFFRRYQIKKKQIQKSGNNSINIQVGGNLNLSSKESKDERSGKK
jgi:membrane protein implicated in regulation of membrane protease activity